jgi:hypothetical protein
MNVTNKEIKEVNIYGYTKDMYKLPEQPPLKEGQCHLCRGFHNKDKPVNIKLTCPVCEKLSEFSVMPHCPGGVSHCEIHNCSECKTKLYLVVYYDGWISIINGVNI